MARPRLLLVFVVLAAVFALVPETKAVPRFPDGSHQICSFIESIDHRCPISITGPNALLFGDSFLKDVVEQCLHNGTLPISETSDTHALLIDLMTYVSITRTCGVVFRAEQVPNIDWIVEVLAKVLSWGPGILSQNCQQLQEFTVFLTDNIFKIFDKLDPMITLIQTLDTEKLKLILPVIPGKLCTFISAIDINLFKKEQIPKLVDALKVDCHSGTTLSTRTFCTWKDSRNVHTTATAAGGSGTRRTEVCVPSEAGKECPIDRQCIEVLCKLDFQLRGCASPCAKSMAVKNCTKEEPTHPCSGDMASIQAVSLPDPATVTAEELSEYACCLVRRREEANKYPNDVLCNLSPPTNSSCLSEFTKWQISRAAKCNNCTGTNHVAALLSPTCQQTAVKMYPTTIEEVISLTRVTIGRNMLLRLYRHIYRNLDHLLEDLVCLQFLQVVTVDNFKKLGIDRLETMLFKMANCTKYPPATAKVLAILIKGETCPITQLKTRGSDLVRLGAVTDNCFMTITPNDALEICTILMTDKAPRISKRKIVLMCKLLERVGDTTCVFCPLKANKMTQPSAEDQASPKLRAERCLALQSLEPAALNSEQLQEMQQCRSCQEGGQVQKPMTPTKWCDRTDNPTKEDIERAVGNVCDLFSKECDQLQCFISKAVKVVMERNLTVDSFSILSSLSIFLPKDRVNGSATFPCTQTRPLCEYVRQQYRHWLISLSRNSPIGRRQAACHTMEIIQRVSQVQVSNVPHILQLEDLQCLSPAETWYLVTTNDFNLEDWKRDQAGVILDKILMHLGKTNITELTEDEVRALGLILIALSPEEINLLRDIDITTFGLLGSSPHWTRPQMRALVSKYLALEKRSPAQLSIDDLLVLQNLIEGFTAQEVRSIPTDAIKEASSVLGSLRLCDPELISALIAHLKTAHGDVTTWDESQLAEYTNLLGGLTTEELNRRGPMVASHISDHVWLYHTDRNRYNALSEEIKEVVADNQRVLAFRDVSCDVVIKGTLDAPRTTDKSVGAATPQYTGTTSGPRGSTHVGNVVADKQGGSGGGPRPTGQWMVLLCVFSLWVIRQ